MTTRACRRRNWPFMILVVIAVLQGTHGQAYRFIIGHHQGNFNQFYIDPNSPVYVTETNTTNTIADLENNNNSTIVVVQNSMRTSSNELSQATMDIITIVWYVATFLALAAFFLLMACSDRRCSDATRSRRLNASDETPIPPPTPSPSYSEFAPPSYDSIMKLQHANRTSIFVIPLSVEQSPKDQSITPTISVYSVDELPKMTS